MLWQASIDDSADRNREKVIISACLVGDCERWRDLVRPWKVKLATNNLNYFKSSECGALSGEFLQFRSEQKYPKPLGREAADKIRDDLDQIIKNSDVRGIGVIVPVPVSTRFMPNHGMQPLSLRRTHTNGLFSYCGISAPREWRN